MDKHLKAFVDILDKEIELYERLKGLLEKKRSFIFVRNIEGIKDVVLEERACISTIESLDLERQDELGRLVDTYGIKVQNIRMLLPHLENEDRNELEDRINRLLSLLNTVAVINLGISDLLQLNLGYIGLLLDLMVKPASTIQTYDSIGKREDEDGKFSIIDLKG